MSVNTWTAPNTWTSDAIEGYDDFENRLSDVLKRKIPEFQQKPGSPLDGYLDAAGDLLDEFRTAIQALSGYLNWADAPLEKIDILGKSFGIDFPRNLNEETRRTIVRDIVNIYKRNGTPDTFRWIFKIVGWDVDLQFAWALNPDEMLKGQERIIYNGQYIYNGSITYGQKNRIDLTQLTYRDFVYGNSVDEADGTFFYGKNYFDTEENTFKKIPIQGEYYPNYRVTPDDTYVASTPYVVVRITEEDYRLFTEDYTDPDTGITYSYTEGEKFQIAEELVNYLLYDQGRPVQVRVIIIVNAQGFTDELPDIVDTYNEVWSADPYIFSDTLPNINSTYLESINVGIVKIGDDHKIGTFTNPYSSHSVLGGLTVTTAAQTLSPVDPDTTENIPVIIPIPATTVTANSRRFIVRQNTDLTFTVPAGVSINLYGTSSLLPANTAGYQLIQSGITGAFNTTLNDIHAIYFEVTNTSSSDTMIVGSATMNALTV